MFTRLILCLALCGSAPLLLPAQTLEWVFYDTGTGCATEQTDCNNNRQCYGLQYTPSITGTATSYTLGFLANCVGGGTAALAGSSCTMTDNTDIQSACDFNLIQILPSGNSGALPVTAGQPVILHQVCLTLSITETMTFNEDESLALTVSIDLPGGGGATDELDYTPFRATAIDCGATLPVVWTDFSAYERGKDVQLDWSVAEEINHDRYVVEWSTDGQSFSELATVRNAGSAIGTSRTYGYIHHDAPAGILYYRIHQHDLDGQYDYSPIATVERTANGNDLLLYPNPATAEVNLAGDAAATGPVRILNTAGALVREFPAGEGRATRALSLLGLPPGVYLVRAGMHTRRLVIR